MLVLLLLTVTVLNCGGRSEVRTFIQHRFPGISKFYCFPMDVENPEQVTWDKVERKWLIAREKTQIGELGIASIVNDASGDGAEGIENFHRDVVEKFPMLYQLQLLRGFDHRRIQVDPAGGSAETASGPSGAPVLGGSVLHGSELCGNCYVSRQSSPLVSARAPRTSTLTSNRPQTHCILIQRIMNAPVRVLAGTVLLPQALGL